MNSACYFGIITCGTYVKTWLNPARGDVRSSKAGGEDFITRGGRARDFARELICLAHIVPLRFDYSSLPGSSRGTDNYFNLPYQCYFIFFTVLLSVAGCRDYTFLNRYKLIDLRLSLCYFHFFELCVLFTISKGPCS